MSKLFEIDNNHTIFCETVNTRNGFKHVGNLYHNGIEIASTKINYINRTWETYEYETIVNALKKYLTK